MRPPHMMDFTNPKSGRAKKKLYDSRLQNRESEVRMDKQWSQELRSTKTLEQMQIENELFILK